MLVITDWKSMQSYKDRTPPWIRLNRKLLDDYNFHKMSDNARALLPMFWLLASEDDDPQSGIIKFQIDEISFRLRLPVEKIKSAIIECINNGFIQETRPCNENVTDPYKISNETVTPETYSKETYSKVTETYPPIVPQRGLAHAKKTSDPDFEDLWKNWQPFEMTKGDKAKALKSYLTARKKKSHDEITRQSEQYQAYCHQSRTKTQHVVTWLNERNRNDWAAQEYPEHGLHPTPADLAYKAQHDLTTRMLQDREKYGIF